MSLTSEAVAWVANLARLELTEAELARYQGQLSSILDYVALLDELDLTELPPTARPIPLVNIWRDDAIEPGLIIEDVLFNAPQQAENQFLIQTVIDE
jgi:aspartyl-tRNA(Asn)/glutamyl-tRNA(Gln) amidotransferase subunit C